jgi:hypothetical protein
VLSIEGLEEQTLEEIDAELAAGCRFVQYEYCISFPLFTLRRPSRIVLLAPGERGVVRGLPYVALTVLLAWWGIPLLALFGLATIFAILGGDSMLGTVGAALLTPIETGKGSGKQMLVPAYILLVLIGWWGVPWGIIYGVQAIFLNLGGGHDMTRRVRRFLEEAAETA